MTTYEFIVIFYSFQLKFVGNQFEFKAMFQITKRTNPINYNPAEIEQINEQLRAVQETTGEEFTTIKEVFNKMLSLFLNAEIPESKIIEKEVIPENILILDESYEKSKEISNRLKSIVHEDSETTNTSIADDVQSLIDLYEKSNESLLLSEENPKTVEVIKEVPIDLKENQMIITITDETKRSADRKIQVLDLVVSNRARKGFANETRETVAEKLIFSKGALLNPEGDVYTGL